MKYFFLLLALFLNTVCSLGQNYVNPTGKQFPIIAWHSLDEIHNTRQNYEMLSEAGFNLSLSFWASYKHVIEGLRESKGTGVNIIPCCMDMRDKPAEFALMVRRSKGIGLYYISDEPSYNDFFIVSKELELLRERDKRHMSYINILPNYASKEQLGKASYEEYLETYVDSVKPDFISFDYYPFVQGNYRSTFFNNLESVYSVCKKHNIPFWGFVRTGLTEDYYEPSEGKIRFQVFINMAYGAKGIQYFTYTTPRGYKTAILDSSYNRTTLYYVIKSINNQIQKIAKYIRNASPEYIWHSDFIKHNPNIDCVEIESADSEGKGFLCSVFKKGVKRYLMIVNKDYENSQKMVLLFKSKVKRVYEKNEIITNGTYESLLAPGDCEIFQF